MPSFKALFLNSNLGSSIIAILLLLFPLFWASSCLKQYGGDLINSWNSENWPSVEGAVEKTELKHYYTKRKTEARTYPVYYPVITYTYSVNSKVYTSQRLTYQISHRNRLEQGCIHTAFSKEKASGIIERYKKNSKVTVYYSSLCPGNSVLEPGAGTWYYYWNTVLSLIVCLILGILLLYFLYLSIVAVIHGK